MEHLIGNKLYVSFKNEDETLSGLLVNVEEHYIYLQQEGTSNLYVVPKSNVKYYVTDSLPNRSRIITPSGNPASQQTPPPPPPAPESYSSAEPATQGVLSVFINGDHIVDIRAPNRDLNVFSDEIARLVLSSTEVQNILAGRKQKAWEYDAGKVYIVTLSDEEEAESVPSPESPSSGAQNTFAMGAAGNIGNQYLTGQQMVDMLNKKVKGDKK